MDSEGTSAAGFGELYRRYSRDVYRFALYLSGDPALAEDIAAEAFLRVWSSPQPVHLESVKAYLIAIARNIYLHELRNLGRRRELAGGIPDTASLARHTESRQELRQALEAMQELPETDRTALLLRAAEGLPYKDIAGVLGISVASAKVKVHRARWKLALRLNRSTP